MKKRGQISIEFIITVGFALVILIPLIVLLYQNSSSTYTEVNTNQAGIVARKIADVADKVYYLGLPTSETIKAYIPETVESINITGRAIILTMESGTQTTAIANVNLTGSVSHTSGLKRIRITALENMVNITDEIE